MFCRMKYFCCTYPSAEALLLDHRQGLQGEDRLGELSFQVAPRARHVDEAVGGRCQSCHVGVFKSLIHVWKWVCNFGNI